MCVCARERECVCVRAVLIWMYTVFFHVFVCAGGGDVAASRLLKKAG